MRIRIWHKLFFSILLVSLMGLAINLGLSRLSFQQGFSEYIESVRLQRLELFTTELAQLHQQKGGWGFIRGDLGLWHRLLSEAELVPQSPQGQPGRYARPEPGIQPPPFAHPPQGSPPGARPPHAPPHRPPAGHRPDRGAAAVDQAGAPQDPFMPGVIGLLDAQKQSLIGPPVTEQTHVLPISLDGQVIGHLSARMPKLERSELDNRFAQQQLENLLMMALISLVIAVIASLLLARLFNRSITRLAGMARHLANGRFDGRIERKTDDELGDLGEDLNTLAETLDRSQRSRRQWIADISHELRTPLTVLRGELEAIEDGVRPLNRDTLASLSAEIGQLQRLVEDLHQLSLSDQGSLSYDKQPLAPLALLKGQVGIFTHTMAQKQISLCLECPHEGVEITADPQRLSQLFANLLENSQRHTDAGGRVIVSCEVDEMLIIHFDDSAPGVAPEMMPYLFERLFRGDPSRSRETGGSGLGLSIAQSIAQAHGGWLKAEASRLGGLKISFHLPLGTEQTSTGDEL